MATTATANRTELETKVQDIAQAASRKFGRQERIAGGRQAGETVTASQR